MLPAALTAFLASQYAYVLRLPFINDDYVFLDVTRAAPFSSLWVPGRLVWLWYRPWSRELHYWTLQHCFDTDVAAWHVTSLALWLVLMLLYFALARRISGDRAAAVSTAGVAAVAAWGLPMVWIAGVQDLWMMTFALGALGAFERGRTVVATLLFVLALLSKETAALLPLAAFVLAWRVRGQPVARAALRTAPLLVTAALWAALHPLLGGRLWGDVVPPPPPVQGAGPLYVAARTLLATLNIDRVPKPEFGWGSPLLMGAVGAVCLAGFVLLSLRLVGEARRGPAPGLTAFAVAWVVAGWAPLFGPWVGWHAYYGLFGMLGAWLLLGSWLARRGGVALAAVVALALLRALQAATVSHDWGDEWYQKRAGEFLGFMRHDLQAKVPAPAPHSRFFFVDVPSAVGFLQGNGPALRVWYGDSTLSGGLFSSYHMRPAGVPPGPDRFFRFDSAGGWIEVHRGAEDVARERTTDRLWREDHERLAIALSGGDDSDGAAAEYAKLARAFPDSANYVYNAGVAAMIAGDSVAGRSWLARALVLPTSDDEIRATARRLLPVAGPGRADR